MSEIYELSYPIKFVISAVTTCLVYVLTITVTAKNYHYKV